MDKFLKTIAFQVSDPEFFAEYEKRQKESGLKVKDYFFGLIRADIEQNPTQTNDSVQEADITQDEPQTAPTEDFAEQQTAEPIAAADEQEQTAPPEQTESDAPVQNEEMMNLFVKIPRAQRVALECHKNQTGETVGNVLNRLIDDFLNHARSGGLPEGYTEAYRPYFDDPKSCDTKASAKIPSKTNQELTDYISLNDGSRNALIAALVDIELNKQEMSEEQEQEHGQSMNM